MRYTAFATIVIGVLIAGFAGAQYASGGPSGDMGGPFTTSLAVPLLVSAALVFAGVAMWVVASGYIASKGTPARPTREAGVLPADNVRHDPPRT